VSFFDANLEEVLAWCTGRGEVTFRYTLSADAPSLLAQSLHEGTHQHIFAASSFGHFHSIIYNLAEDQDVPGPEKELYAELASTMRTNSFAVHEGFATFSTMLGLLLDLEAIPPSIMGGLPSSYLAAYELARCLLPEPPAFNGDTDILSVFKGCSDLLAIYCCAAPIHREYKTWARLRNSPRRFIDNDTPNDRLIALTKEAHIVRKTSSEFIKAAIQDRGKLNARSDKTDLLEYDRALAREVERWRFDFFARMERAIGNQVPIVVDPRPDISDLHDNWSTLPYFAEGGTLIFRANRFSTRILLGGESVSLLSEREVSLNDGLEIIAGQIAEKKEKVLPVLFLHDDFLSTALSFSSTRLSRSVKAHNVLGDRVRAYFMMFSHDYLGQAEVFPSQLRCWTVTGTVDEMNRLASSIKTLGAIWFVDGPSQYHRAPYNVKQYSMSPSFVRMNTVWELVNFVGAPDKWRFRIEAEGLSVCVLQDSQESSYCLTEMQGASFFERETGAASDSPRQEGLMNNGVFLYRIIMLGELIMQHIYKERTFLPDQNLMGQLSNYRAFRKSLHT